MNIQLFYDGANLDLIHSLFTEKKIQGVTTNPSLMRKEEVTDYESYSKKIIQACMTFPVSIEICADRPDEILRQARIIANWGEAVYVKVPIIRRDGSFNADIIHTLSGEGIKVNVTAIMTVNQVKVALDSVQGGSHSIISIFSGRIADTGRDPTPTIIQAVAWARCQPNIQILWASTREVYNVIQAEKCGCHIITVPPDILKKIPILGNDLDEITLDTVKTFYQDAQESGLSC